MLDSGIILSKSHWNECGPLLEMQTPIEILSSSNGLFGSTPRRSRDGRGGQPVPPHMRIRLITGQTPWMGSVHLPAEDTATPIPSGIAVIAGGPGGRTKMAPTRSQPTRPPVKCRCGSDDFIPEQDVLDTWMDSSIRPSRGWLANRRTSACRHSFDRKAMTSFAPGHLLYHTAD